MARGFAATFFKFSVKLFREPRKKRQSSKPANPCGSCERNRRRKASVLSPASFSAHRKLAQICPKPARNSSLGQGYSPPPKEGTQRPTRANRGHFCAGALGTTIQQAGGGGCARLQRASAFSGVAAPQGCGSLFFGYSVVIFVLSSVYPKRGNIRVAAGGHNVLSNSPESDSKSFSGVGMLPSPKESHTAAHRGKHGAFCAEVL